MSLRTTTAFISAGAALAATGPITVATDAGAALTTRCVGEAGAVTVPGDLVVPAGSSCALSGTTVQGQVRVQPGADLLLRDGAVVTGDLRLAADAFADVSGSTVEGQLIGRGLYGARLDGATVAGNVTIRSDAAYAGIPYVVTAQSSIGGSVDVRVGEVVLDGTSVANDVTTRGAELTDILDSTITGTLTVRENAFGSAVCASEIYGDATYRQNGYGLQLGGAGALGPCEGTTFWGGNVAVVGNEATDVGIDVSNNIVAGALSGDGNAPAPTGAGNRIRGGASGEFADLQPAGSAGAADAQQRTMAATAAPAPRDAKADEQLTARQATAAAEASQAGPAQLVP